MSESTTRPTASEREAELKQNLDEAIEAKVAADYRELEEMSGQ